MLYKLSKTGDAFSGMEPMPYHSFANFGQVEKDLENLLAENMLDVLFEGRQLMPIFQERSRQAEADIYALNRAGDLVIFELKRATAGGDAVHQALRYCDEAARWDYTRLESMYNKYMETTSESLQAEHQRVFDLETPLAKAAFNNDQELMIVGTAGNDELMHRVDYWKSKGIKINFLPYRIYTLGGEQYFEFFSPPYDQHSNPAHKRGIIFDTCLSHIADSLEYMLQNFRVATFGDQKHLVGYLTPGDTVFLYHKGHGIVAAGEVLQGGVKEDTSTRDARYREVKWLNPIPSQGTPRALSAASIKKLLGQNFFWARTLKTPYLNPEQSKKLIDELSKINTPNPS